MAEVYFYVPSEEAGNAVECGLKLSTWYEKEVTINGEVKKCISALLNPKDDPIKYKSAELKCLKLELLPKYCYVADSLLYQVGLDYPEVMELYNYSIIPLERYIFGSYRLPECLITSTAINGQVAILDKRLDSPILFDKSEDLYVNNLIQIYKEEHDDFNDAMIYSFYCKLAEIGRVKKIEDGQKKIAVFLDPEAGKSFVTRVIDLSSF